MLLTGFLYLLCLSNSNAIYIPESILVDPSAYNELIAFLILLLFCFEHLIRGITRSADDENLIIEILSPSSRILIIYSKVSYTYMILFPSILPLVSITHIKSINCLFSKNLD